MKSSIALEGEIPVQIDMIPEITAHEIGEKTKHKNRSNKSIFEHIFKGR